MSLDFDSVFYACKLSITGALIAGLFGYFIGKTFDKAGRSEGYYGFGKNNGLFIDDVLDNDLDSLDFEEEIIEKTE